MVIEFKMYANAGDATPYYSIKCTNIAFNSFCIGSSTPGNGFAEQITLSPVIFGYKNWVNLATYRWNQATRMLVAY